MSALKGRVAVITGAGSGVGAATASLMAARGAAVLIADIDQDRAQNVAAEIKGRGGEAEAVTVDVAQESGVIHMIGVAMDKWGRVDILHNNAAALSADVLSRDGDLRTMTVEFWDFTMGVTLRGVMLGCKHVIGHMVERGSGVILNTASTAGQTGDLVRPAYGAAKAGVINFTRYVATMYGRHGVRCNAIAPGLVLSPPALANMSAEQLDISRRNRLVERAGTPRDIAAMAAFLASDDAAFVTGQVINVDGGVLAHFPNYADQIRAQESQLAVDEK
jgi:NAD(P)-dependent dehydrogenase (short-subunit alcohol dehydrogenase family)